VEDAVIQAYIDACRAGAVIPLSMTGTGLQELVGDIMRELKVSHPQVFQRILAYQAKCKIGRSVRGCSNIRAKRQ
jgi:hypothetical protein